MGDADFWELLTKSGISPDSATAIVNSHRGMGDADLWERLTQNGAPPDAATNIVKARGSQTAVPSSHGTSGTWTDAPQPSNAAHLLNTFSGIPGVERLEALAGQGASYVLPSMFGGKPISYEQSLGALRSATGEIDPKTAALEKFLGTMALAPILPKNPVAAGALLGGADQALSADPVNSLLGRATSTAVGAGVGAATGKLADMAVTGVQSLFASKPAANLLAKQAERAASASKLYGAAIAEGKQATATPAIQSFLAEPDIAEIVGELKQTRPFAGVPADSPEMLDAVYKTLSDRAATIKRGLESVTPNRPNIGRFRAQDISAAKTQALGAMDQTMPSYRTAVNDFAQRTKEMDALRKGYDALIRKAANTAPSAKQLTKSTPEAFADWATRASPIETSGATQGILGGTKQELMADNLLSLHRRGRSALSAAGGLLRAANPNALPIASTGLLGLYGYSQTP